MLNNIIKYTGLNNLSDFESSKVREIMEKNYSKIQRLLKNNVNLSVNVKTHKKAKTSKYSIHLRVEAPTSIFSTEATDWDLPKATHSAIEGVITEIQHKLKINRKDAFILKRVLRKAQKVKTTI